MVLQRKEEEEECGWLLIGWNGAVCHSLTLEQVSATLFWVRIADCTFKALRKEQTT